MVSARGDNLNSRKLKSKRVEKGINQTLIAKSLGITVKTYSFKENARSEFTRSEIYEISNILGLNIHELNEIFFNNEITDCIN